MNKVLLGILFYTFSLLSYAEHCPDPITSSLSTGVVPAPWHLSPFSEHDVQGEIGTRFVRANIIVLGRMGRGIICTYHNSVGHYSIWWPTNVKVPGQIDYNWHDSLGGFECRNSIGECAFYP